MVHEAMARAPLGLYAPNGSADMYAALDAHPVKGKRVLVVGTLIPWVEAILIAYEVGELVTVDFNPIVVDYPPYAGRWTSLDIAGLNTMGCCFDVIVSFSSQEHDGLGRYGDPINPHGDLRRMNALGDFLSPGGIFLLAVPVGPDVLYWNAHRIYGPIRFGLLTKGWDIVGLYENHNHTLESLYALQTGDEAQPVVVLQRKR